MKKREGVSKKDIMNYIGVLSNETAERMLKSVKEFRKLKSRRFK